MDALKLNYKSKDQLHPLLSELMASLNKSMAKDFEGRARIVQWLITLNQMRAADEVSDDQIRQVQMSRIIQS
jgi:ESCRT-I complex subunit VPS28